MSAKGRLLPLALSALCCLSMIGQDAAVRPANSDIRCKCIIWVCVELQFADKATIGPTLD